jgi:Rod binding domain-containing protein
MATSMIGPNAMNAQATLQQSREMQMLQQVNSARGANDDAKIEKGARQFEAMLLSNWLQQAEQSFATVPGAEDDEDAPGREQMMSLGVQSMAESLAASGGIGIAKMIAKAMHAVADRASAAAENAAGGAENADNPAESQVSPQPNPGKI